MEKYEKRGYLLENFRLFHLNTQGTAPVDFHYHEFCKLLLLVSGQGSYYIDGQHYLLSPGDILFIGSHSIHKPEPDRDAPYERYIIYVSPRYLEQLSHGDCDLTRLFSPEEGHMLRLREPDRRRLFELAAQLEQSLSREGFGRDLLSAANLTRLLVELGRCRENREEEHMPSRNRRIREILGYLNQNITEPIDIDALAERFYISKFHMMRAFRRETGATIHVYLTQKRPMLARERMDGGMSATEACYSCGFRSYSSFTRAYGKYYGSTPTGRSDKKLVRDEDYE